ncbi:hypothetical protein OAJ57_04730 [Alphaproteobacteria bacterium]|nr:hypothetical protein [Alphaproteobacteria bacterium]
MAYLIEVSRTAAGMPDNVYPTAMGPIIFINLSDNLSVTTADAGRTVGKANRCN